MCCREGLDRPPRMPKGTQPTGISSATLDTQTVQLTHLSSTATSSRTTGPKSILNNSKGKFQDPVSELLYQKKTMPRDVAPFEREREEDSLTKLRRLHEKNVLTTSNAVKSTGRPKFGHGAEEKHGGAIITSDSSSDDEIPSIKRALASTTSRAIRSGLTKRYGIALDDVMEKSTSPVNVVPTAPMIGTSRTMSPDKDDAEMDIDAWLDKEIGVGRNG